MILSFILVFSVQWNACIQFSNFNLSPLLSRRRELKPSPKIGGIVAVIDYLIIDAV
jgi:hypothetical protein